MIHPVFRLAAARPQLLAEHAAAYANLLGEELALGSAGLKRQLALQLTGAACLVVAAVLLGVALLLWAASPDAGVRVLWLFVLTPVLPAAIGLWVLWLARERDALAPFARLRMQLAEDAALLRFPDAP